MNGKVNMQSNQNDPNRANDPSVRRNSQSGYKQYMASSSSSLSNSGGENRYSSDSSPHSFGRPSPHNLPAGSGAASMLMAANALAQTPAQNVSEALLGQVQIAAEGQILQHRRESAGLLPDLSYETRNENETNSGTQRRPKSLSQSHHSDFPSGQGSITNNLPPPFSVHPASVGIQGSIANHLHTAAKIGAVQASSASAFSAAQLVTSNVYEPSAQQQQQQVRASFQANDVGISGIQGGFDGINIAPQGGQNSQNGNNGVDTVKQGQPFSFLSQQQTHPSQAMLLASRGLPHNYNQSNSSKHAAGWYAPLSPRTQAQVQVGNIAANVAVHEYIAQTVSTNITSEGSNRWYDPSQPFQGVPSTPMMPSPSPAMLPPPDIVMGMRTPFSSSNNNVKATNQTNFVPS